MGVHTAPRDLIALESGVIPAAASVNGSVITRGAIGFAGTVSGHLV